MKNAKELTAELRHCGRRRKKDPGRRGICRLGASQSIDYSCGEIDMEVTPMNRPMSAGLMLADRMDAGISMDVNSDDIEMVETVTVISRWN